jgi:hypothetical protein
MKIDVTNMQYIIKQFGLFYCIGHSTATGGKEKYRPSYLDHFEKKEQESQVQRAQPPAPAPQPVPQKQVTPPHHFQRSLIDGDFEFVSKILFSLVPYCCF